MLLTLCGKDINKILNRTTFMQKNMRVCRKSFPQPRQTRTPRVRGGRPAMRTGGFRGSGSEVRGRRFVVGGSEPEVRGRRFGAGGSGSEVRGRRVGAGGSGSEVQGRRVGVGPSRFGAGPRRTPLRRLRHARCALLRCALRWGGDVRRPGRGFAWRAICHIGII